MAIPAANDRHTERTTIAIVLVIISPLQVLDKFFPARSAIFRDRSPTVKKKRANPSVSTGSRGWRGGQYCPWLLTLTQTEIEAGAPFIASLAMSGPGLACAHARRLEQI